MVHTLRALHNSPELLLNTMDVFVKEPSLDWKVCTWGFSKNCVGGWGAEGEVFLFVCSFVCLFVFCISPTSLVVSLCCIGVIH